MKIDCFTQPFSKVLIPLYVCWGEKKRQPLSLLIAPEQIHWEKIIKKLFTVIVMAFFTLGLQQSLRGNCTPTTLAHWNFNACQSSSSSGTNADYSEFTAQTYNTYGAYISASNAYRNSGTHSCTPGVGGTPAMCMGTQQSCTTSDYAEEWALRFDVTVNPSSMTNLTSLQFYEKAPYNYNYINGGSGPNNYPTKYLVKVEKNGQLIYSEENIPTSSDWSLESYDFSSIPGFSVSSTATFTFELRAYCRVGNGASKAVWDVDEIKVLGCSGNINFPPVGNTCSSEIVKWDLESCYSNSNTPNSGSDYSEFTPTITTPNECGGNVSASIVYREEGTHSCSPGYDGNVAMCVGTRSACDFLDDNEYALRFDVTVTPVSGGTASLSGLSFFEKAPEEYSWIAGGKGSNNYPTKYGIRVTANGNQVYKQVGIATTRDWTLETFDFSGNPNFTVSYPTTFSFELRGYCRVGNGASESVWDIDNIKAFGCCEGPCSNAGGDSDSDGVCNDQDCAPFDLNFPKPAGTACNDGNPNTVNDVIQGDGCTCAGVFDPCANNGGDSDGDGTCNNQDCAPFDPNFPKPVGTACNDYNPNTVNDVIQGDGCTCAGVIPVCDNVTMGGTIGFSLNCSLSTTVCNQDLPLIVNCNSPIGGSGDIEIIWLKAVNNPNCYPPTTTVDNIANDPYWSIINGENDLSLSPGTITGKTCFLRCVRRAGCDVYIESNIIVADIDPNCGGSGSPNCDTDITITAGNGTITIGGLDGSPVSTLQVFNSDWGQEYSCVADCGATETINVPNGTYFVSAKYYTSAWQPICEKFEEVTVGGSGGGPCDNQGGDSDGDGVCNDQDCRPYDAAYPATPGTPCNDGDPNTENDAVTSDGCGCAGTPGGGGGSPNCDTDITITVSNGTIIVAGLDGSPVTTLQVFNSSWGQEYSCTADCNPTETVSVASGTYFVSAKYYTSGWQPICEKFEEVMVGGGGGGPCDNQGGDSDGDGVCNNQDCKPYDAAYPATPGTPCDDGDPNTENDAVTTDGCGCAGTPIGSPCDNQGGDSDGDGVCNDQDCKPYDAAYPATPGTPCNDSDPNTENDVVTSDGCGCAGTPGGGGGSPNCDTDITITASSGTITVTGLDGAPVSTLQVFNSSWGQEYSCTADCNPTETVSVASGTYYVSAKYYTSGWQPICEKFEEVTVGGGGDPCDNQGGDSDSDGVCNDHDCQPFDAAYPATPGTPCNDGDPDTENDVVTSDGCGCTGTPINSGCTSETLVVWNLDACASCSNGSNMVWDELTPFITGNGNCANISATAVSPANGEEHSCTPGQSNTAMCIGAGVLIKFSATLNESNSRISGLSFYEQAPPTYVWTSPNNVTCSGTITGDNNPPSKFDLNVYRDGSLVYSTTENTQSSWNLRTFDFANTAGFDEAGTYTFELYAYNPLSIGSVKAWDIDEIAIMGCCGDGGGGGTGDCANIEIQGGTGKITVSGLDGGEVSSLQVFSSDWSQQHFNCFDNCNATEEIALLAGDYMVFAKFYDSSYNLICEKDATVSVVNALANNGQFEFEVVKEMEHAEIFWMHNEGSSVESYVIERSSDGFYFAEVVDDQPSVGGTDIEIYRAYDLSPLKGDNFYRIKMEMTDGTSEYSAIRKIHYSDLVDFIVFPNPANNFAHVNLESIIGFKDVDIHVYNNLGIRIKHFHLDEVYSKYYQMDLREFHEGHYSVWINIPGKRPRVTQLVIGRL